MTKSIYLLIFCLVGSVLGCYAGMYIYIEQGQSPGSFSVMACLFLYSLLVLLFCCGSSAPSKNSSKDETYELPSPWPLIYVLLENSNGDIIKVFDSRAKAENYKKYMAFTEHNSVLGDETEHQHYAIQEWEVQ